MISERRTAIIDIGSNSIRLVIYEELREGAHRVISEFKESARLSQRIAPDGTLPPEGIAHIVHILTRFKRICSVHGVSRFRAAATAAIRNAANSTEIIETLCRESGLHIEMLSGEDEARIGFLGMIHTMDIEDGLLIDIGGGSTEVTLFRNRKLQQSASFPFGAVNTTKKFAQDGEFNEVNLKAIKDMVVQALESETWIKEAKGLPLVGLGGTMRTLCKIHQKKLKYSLPLAHNYQMSREAMNELLPWLSSLPGEKRKKVEGLSKDRFDIIVPGLVILQTVCDIAQCTHYIVSGAGLRDGLYVERALPIQNEKNIALQSAKHLNILHSTAPEAHIAAVEYNALVLFDALRAAGCHDYDERTRLCLQTAARLYRVGASLSYYPYAKHSYYIIAHARIDGMTHKEMVLCALIASYKGRSAAQQLYQAHSDILNEADFRAVIQLGLLLQLAIALDASETEPLHLVHATLDDKFLLLNVSIQHDASAEYREVEGLEKEFRKWWRYKPITCAIPSSMS